MVDLAFAPPGRTGRGPLCPDAEVSTRTVIGPYVSAVAWKQKSRSSDPSWPVVGRA